MIANTFKHQNPVDATLSPLGNSQNSKWRQRGITPFLEPTVKACSGQKSAFSCQKESKNVTQHHIKVRLDSHGSYVI